MLHDSSLLQKLSKKAVCVRHSFTCDKSTKPLNTDTPSGFLPMVARGASNPRSRRASKIEHNLFLVVITHNTKLKSHLYTGHDT